MAQKLNIFLCMAFLATPTYSMAGDPIAVDKAAHFGLSAVSTQACIRTGQLLTSSKKITWTNRLVSSGIVAALGIAKEIQDKNKKGSSKLDQLDLEADASGIIVGNILLFEF